MRARARRSAVARSKSAPLLSCPLTPCPRPARHPPSPPTSPDTILTILLMAIYSADILLNFFVSGVRNAAAAQHHRLNPPAPPPQSCAIVDTTKGWALAFNAPLAIHAPPPHAPPQVAYHDEDGYLVTDRQDIARHYTEWRLWVDLGTTIPFDCERALQGGVRATRVAAPRKTSPLQQLVQWQPARL